MDKAAGIIKYLGDWLKVLINTIIEAADFLKVNFDIEVNLPVTK